MILDSSKVHISPTTNLDEFKYTISTFVADDLVTTCARAPLVDPTIFSPNTEDVSNDDDMKAALAFIKEQDEKQAFRDRLAMELEKEKGKAHHTRTIVKLKFPDDYILEAAFG